MNHLMKTGGMMNWIGLNTYIKIVGKVINLSLLL